MSVPHPGSELGRYRVEGLVGRGGMGAVYRAVDLRLGRTVALKLLAPELTADAGFRSRFLTESRRAAALDHAGVVPVYEAGEEGGRLFIAMRFVDGVDLAELLRRDGPLEPARAVRIAAQVADALEAAHRRGLVHRDVKPSNILIAREDETDRALLADFGLARDTRAPDGATAPGAIVGTIAYLAPETIRGDAADARADVYALGCVLFECLTGRPPFPGPSDVAVLYAHLEEEPPRARTLRPGVPRALDEVVARALAKDPARRWSSAAAFAAAMRGAVQPGARGPRRRVPRPRAP